MRTLGASAIRLAEGTTSILPSLRDITGKILTFSTVVNPGISWGICGTDSLDFSTFLQHLVYSKINFVPLTTVEKFPTPPKYPTDWLALWWLLYFLQKESSWMYFDLFGRSVLML